MTYHVDLPEAFTQFKQLATSHDVDKGDDCWDAVGDPLDKPVKDLVPAYYEKLELGEKSVAMSKRGEILDLAWGRVEQDGAALVGLGKALENLSETIKANVESLRDHWSGESYDAFAAAMGKIGTTLDAYSAAATTVGDTLVKAMTQAREMYEDYAIASVKALAFEWVSRPDEWHKMDEHTAGHFAMVCPSGMFGCKKTDDEVAGKLKGKFVTNRQLEACEHDPCDDNLERVHIMYDNLVTHGEEGRQRIRERVEDWCRDTDGLKESIRELLKVAVGNVYTLGRSTTFASLHVVGGGQPAGGDPGSYGGGQPAGGDSGAGYPGGGDPVSSSPPPEVEVPAEQAPEAELASEDAVATDEAAADGPAADETAAQGDAAETDTAETDATETDATEGDAAEGDTTEGDATEQAADAAAGGQPVVEEPGTVTITDQGRTIGVRDSPVEGHITVTVTGPDGVRKTYDLDFDAASGLVPRGGDPAEPEDGVERIPAYSNGKCVIHDGDISITAERPLFAPDQLAVTVDDGTGGVSKHTIDLPEVTADQDIPADAPQPDAAADQVTQPEAPEPDPAVSQARQAAPSDAPEQPAEHTAADEQPEQVAADQPVNGSARQDTTATADVKPPESWPTDADEPQAATTSAKTTSVHATSAQAWAEDARGSVSGVLVPEQPNGEAGLASAPDADQAQPDDKNDATGIAGAGLPMAGPGPGGQQDSGRPGSGWSVHGDLFDTGEPVYSMHGVLGDEDAERTDG